MKRLLLLMFSILLLAGCTQHKDGEPVDAPEEDQAEETVAEPEEATEPKEEEPADEPVEEESDEDESDQVESEIEVNNELTFAEFTIRMNEVEVDGDEVNISFDWLNQAGDGDKTFMAVAALDVEQGDELLEETTGAWDVMNKNSSDIYFPNAQNGEKEIELTYELVNDEDLTITFVPLNEHDESQELTIELK